MSALLIDGNVLSQQMRADFAARSQSLISQGIRPGLAVVLVFIGGKMCLIDIFKIPVGISLGVVVGILAVTMLLSVRSSKA